MPCALCHGRVGRQTLDLRANDPRSTAHRAMAHSHSAQHAPGKQVFEGLKQVSEVPKQVFEHGKHLFQGLEQVSENLKQVPEVLSQVFDGSKHLFPGAKERFPVTRTRLANLGPGPAASPRPAPDASIRMATPARPD